MLFFKTICLAIVTVFIVNISICPDVSGSLIVPDLNLNQEQSANFRDHDLRISRIIDIVFPDITKEQKLAWRMLLLGTVSTETNFLNRYSGKSRNGNGPYQIIGDTAHGIIHRFITYPLAGLNRIAKRQHLIPVFEEATGGRLQWTELYSMTKDELVELCVNDYDFACLVSLFVYKDAFRRHGINEISSNPAQLASLWKAYYNTELGLGTETRFIERFMQLYYHII